MKIYFTLLLCILLLNLANAQDNTTSDNIWMNAFSLEVYQPVVTKELNDIFNKGWILGENSEIDSSISRKHRSIGLGLSYEGMLSRNSLVRARVGISSEKTFEQTEYSSTPSPSQYTIFKKQYDYEQIHMNLFLGVAKRFYLFEKVTCDIGIDIPFITYLNSESEYLSTREDFEGESEEVLSSRTTKVNTSYGNAFLFGIGPLVKVEHLLSRNIFISVESQFYFLFNRVNSPVTTRRTSFSTSTTNISSDSVETDVKASLWNWSKISPLIRFGFKF